MIFRRLGGLLVAFGFAAILLVAPLSGARAMIALTECGGRYKKAKADGTLGGMSWREFRKAKCGEAAAAPAPIARTDAVPLQARIDKCSSEWKANKAALQKQYETWPKYWSACNGRIKPVGK